MKNIMIIPLDERPCNTNFVKYLTKDTPFNLLLPPRELLGDKKQKANIPLLHKWILDNSTKIDHLILSIDMLVYGGIVPSRLHNDSLEDLQKRLEIIKKIKEINPRLSIYAFNLIMRNPTYSSSDEEPDYYEEFGREIHLKGVYEHKKSINIISDQELKELHKINQILPAEIYKDYTDRRSLNTNINLQVINLLEENIIDYLVIPQDDASEFGLTKLDQTVVLSHIKNKELDNTFLMYPDADAVVNALLARYINKVNNIKPSFYLYYAVNEAKNMIPLFEDRPLQLSIASQIAVVGGVISTNLENSDIVLAINATTIMRDINSTDKDQYHHEYYELRNLDQFIDTIKSFSKPVVIADIAYSNGSDRDLIVRLKEHNLLYKLAGYAAWNTSGNTLGTCIAQGCIYNLYQDTMSHLDFLALRYVEDFIYMTLVRKEVSEKILPKLNLNYFNTGEKQGKVSETVYSMLNKYKKEYLDTDYKITITNCYMPWARMFEVGIDVIVQKPL